MKMRSLDKGTLFGFNEISNASNTSTELAL